MFKSVLLFSTCIHLASANIFVPHKISFGELSFQSTESSETLRNALSEVGLITISEIPGFSHLREQVLLAASDCALHSKTTGAGEGNYRFIFPDGTSRYTLGSKTKGGEAFTIGGADLSSPACEKFDRVQTEFRSIVDTTSRLFIQRVDQIQEHGFGRRLLLDKETGNFFDSLSEVVNAGVQLEHFHTYEKFPSAADDLTEFTIDLHVDHGLFIVLSPALVLTGNNQNHGFVIELKDGQIVQPYFGEGGNELVFMIGDGYTQWLNPQSKVQFRATPHAMTMPNLSEDQVRFGEARSAIRSWYGRMFLPSDSAFLESQQKTFGEIKEGFKSRQLQTETAMSACSDGYSISPRDLSVICANNEVLCWASCRADPGCQSNQVAKCMKDLGDNSSAECDGSTHDGGCKVTCTLVDQQPVEIGNDFCNGFTVSMFMAGFTGAGDNKQECLVFLFQNFVLDDQAKYAVASLATIVLGIFTEFIVSLRRRVTQTFKEGITKKILKVVLYAGQVTFGYFAMLIAMTYSAVLFIMIVVGLSIGHVLFNFNTKVKENTEHCCPEDLNDPEDAKPMFKATPVKEVKETLPASSS